MVDVRCDATVVLFLGGVEADSDKTDVGEISREVERALADMSLSNLITAGRDDRKVVSVEVRNVKVG